MAKGRIRVLRAIPGSTSLGPILRAFGSKDSGIVTAFSDSHLLVCRQLLGEDSDLEVISFSEVVRNVLIQCGEDVLPATQSGHKQAAIAYACRQLEGTSPFHACEDFAGFHEAVGKTLDELHLWGIDADAMSDMASVASPRLAAKLNDLSELDRSITEVLELLGRQLHSHQLRLSLESTLELEGDTDRLLVFADAEECPLRMQWLKWIASQGFDVTIVLDRHATDAPIFHGAANSIKLIGVDPEDRGDGNRLVRNLFAGEEYGGAPVAMSVVSAADPLAEVEWAIRGCLAAQEDGRVAIYVRDLESYAPLIESAAKRFGASIHMARRAPLMTNSFARLTLAALQFCASDDVRTLSVILKSSYLRLTGNAQNELDTELRTCFSQKKAQWQVLEAWAEVHTDTHAWLTALLEWRRVAIENALPLAEWFPKIQEFNRDQRLPWARLENKGGEMDERDRRALNQMERLLVNHISIDRVTDRTTMYLSGLVNLCERLWTDGDVSIPTSEDGIRVTSEPNVVGEVDRLHVLGMLEGIFPRRRSEDPILTDAERAEINSLRSDAPPLQDSYGKAQQERDEFYRVCATARRQIVFSYPLADDQRDNIPAFYLKEAERAVGGESLVTTHDYPRPELAPAIELCFVEADRKLRIAMDGPREAPLPLEIVSPTARELIRPLKGAAFRPDVLRDALQCPFQYLVRHVLHLRVNRQSERWGSLRKLPQAALLLTNDDLTSAEQALIVALDAELDRLYAEVPDWEMQLLKSGGQRLIRDWLHREKRSREEWTKDEGSMMANVAFGTHGTRDTMPGDVKLQGYLAGLSRLENYNVAHIFGSVASDPKNLTDTEKLYLGLHMLAIHEPGRDGAIEIESTSGKRTLMVLGRGASRPIASSVEDGLQVIDLATSDDPSQSKKAFFAEVKKALAEAVQRIMQGRVDATKGDHCDWCDYGELCRRSRGFGEEDSPFDDDRDGDDV